MLAFFRKYAIKDETAKVLSFAPFLITNEGKFVMTKHSLPRKYGKGNSIPQGTRQEIINLYLSGNSCRKVGAAFGIAGTTVLKILVGNGIKTRHKREYRPKTGERESKIIRGYLKGYSTTKLAKKFNVNVTTINNVLSDKNIPIRKVGNYRTKTVGVDKDVMMLYASGLSFLETGKKMNLSSDAIRDVLLRNNIKPRDNSGENHRSWKGGVNKDIVYKRAYKNANRKKRRANDPLFKLEETLRSRVSGFFRSNRKNGKLLARKNNRTFALLGADKKTIFFHIEAQFREGMAWDNHGKIWHIDHIIPLASAKTEEELLPLFYYKNLQPLFVKENIAKKDRLDWKLNEEVI